MSQQMTWEEMKRLYPNEWLLIIDFELDLYGGVARGVVNRHSKEKIEVYRPPMPAKECAFEYTGESTFPGGWRAHANCHHL
jgi:hypothetical protein